MRSFSHWPIAAKLSLLALLAALPPVAILVFQAVPTIDEQAFESRRAQTQHLVETAHGVLAHYGALAERGTLSLDDAQAAAREQVAALRYDGDQYFWVTDLEPRMVVHPFRPDLADRAVGHLEDPDGVPLFAEMVRVARQDGAGFVDYRWPRPGQDLPVDKISYVQLYEPWGWVVGSGLYVDDLQAELGAFHTRTWTAVAILTVLVGLLVAFLQRRITGPIRHLSRTAERISHGETGAAADLTAASGDEIGRVTESVRQMTGALEKRSTALNEVLDAALTVAQADDLDAGLQQLLASARRVSGARYAALSTFAPDGTLDRFVTLGMDAAAQRGIAHPPAGKGLLGHIHHTQQTLRLDDMTKHSASAGFPDGHPPMTSLLAVPILHRGTSLGNLYLTDRVDEATGAVGPFTDLDQALVERLADLVAVSIAGRRGADALKAQQAYLGERVSYMLERMNRFADGDLSVRLATDRDDEIAQLFNGFNRAAAQLHAMIDEVSRAAQDTAAASATISASTGQLAASAQAQNLQAEEVAAAVEQMVSTIIENSRNATRTSEVAAESGREAHDGGAVVARTVDKIREIADVVSTSAATVERLGDSSQAIGDIVQVISEIADQTNLLALNAAIEAARAGDQGRGFAVVADEVRKLAERTTKATAEIDQMIQQVQHETQQAVGAMQRGNAEVDAGIQLADEARGALQRIVGGTEHTVDLINQIAAASEEQSTTSEQIARSMEVIRSASGESALGLQHIDTSTHQLNALTESLSTLVGRFTTSAAETTSDLPAVAPARPRPAAGLAASAA